MSIYQKLTEVGSRYIGLSKLIKFGFNFSPMYRRSTAKITSVSPDLMDIKIIIRLNYKNRNYVNSIFGGSMFSAVDPIPMVQLINLIGKEFVVWDKSAEIFFKRPAKENLYADFQFTHAELDSIKKRVEEENEIEIVKQTLLTNFDKSVIYCIVNKTIYVAKKDFYQQKRLNKNKKTTL